MGAFQPGRLMSAERRVAAQADVPAPSRRTAHSGRQATPACRTKRLKLCRSSEAVVDRGACPRPSSIGSRRSGGASSSRSNCSTPGAMKMPMLWTSWAVSREATGQRHRTASGEAVPDPVPQSQKSVEAETLRQSARIAASATCLASIAATVSLPSGRRTGGLGASTNRISTSASFAGSPG